MQFLQRDLLIWVPIELSWTGGETVIEGTFSVMVEEDVELYPTV